MREVDRGKKSLDGSNMGQPSTEDKQITSIQKISYISKFNSHFNFDYVQT